MAKFDSLVMQHGNRNAPGTMMRGMNYPFREVKEQMIYLDDILMANHTYEEHINSIRQVLRITKQNELWFNRHKCQLMSDKLAILGDYLTEQELEADPVKVNSIQQFPKPDNRRQLQRFLGKVNYLRQSCTELAAAAARLSQLHVSTKQWKWTDLHSYSFHICKDLIMSNKVLKPINPNPNQRIYLICNSSNRGLSGWIDQMQDNGIITPARFHSKKFHNAQMNYGIIKKEFLAIVDSVRHFRGVLQGHTVTIIIDHQPLVAFMSSLQTNQMMIRWQESLSQLDITIEHIDRKSVV